jgi:predicted ABC-type exoprotein transport system permease subunit
VVQGFSNTLCVVILVLLVAPMAMQSTDKEDVVLCVGIFLMSFAFPVLGYVVTWDQP